MELSLYSDEDLLDELALRYESMIFAGLKSKDVDGIDLNDHCDYRWRFFGRSLAEVIGLIEMMREKIEVP